MATGKQISRRSNPRQNGKVASSTEPPLNHALCRKLIWSLSMLLGGTWLVAAIVVSTRGAATGHHDKAAEAGHFPSGTNRVLGQAGPWGRLSSTRIVTELPSHMVSLERLYRSPPKWFLAKMTRDEVVALFRAAELTDEQRASLLQQDRWQVNADSVVVYPELDLLVGMNPRARKQIYAVLARFPENAPQRTVYSFRPEFLEERIQDSGLSADSTELFRSLLYPHGALQLFADLLTVMPRLPDDDERRRFLKMVCRKSTVLAELQIGPETDIESVINYWSGGGRAKDLRPFLQSVARVPGGCSVDIVHLLPPMVRQRLYTYPAVFNHFSESRENCHWTSLNFFRAVPDDRFHESAHAAHEMESAYTVVPKPGQLGDLIVLAADSVGGVFHSAVYIADDLVFTKNGADFTQPWIFMRLNDMIEFYVGYVVPGDEMKIRCLRRRDSAT